MERWYENSAEGSNLLCHSFQVSPPFFVTVASCTASIKQESQRPTLETRYNLHYADGEQVCSIWKTETSCVTNSQVWRFPRAFREARPSSLCSLYKFCHFSNFCFVRCVQHSEGYCNAGRLLTCASRRSSAFVSWNIDKSEVHFFFQRGVEVKITSNARKLIDFDPTACFKTKGSREDMDLECARASFW